MTDRNWTTDLAKRQASAMPPNPDDDRATLPPAHATDEEKREQFERTLTEARERLSRISYERVNGSVWDKTR